MIKLTKSARNAQNSAKIDRTTRPKRLNRLVNILQNGSNFTFCHDSLDFLVVSWIKLVGRGDAVGQATMARLEAQDEADVFHEQARGTGVAGHLDIVGKC